MPHTPPPAPTDLVHDLQHQVGLVREALRSEKRRLVFFLGAGCPLGIYDMDEVKSVKHLRHNEDRHVRLGFRHVGLAAGKR